MRKPPKGLSLVERTSGANLRLTEGAGAVGGEDHEVRAAHLDLDDRCDGDADASAWRATEMRELTRLEDVVDICVERVREQNRNLDACLVLACLSLDRSNRADGDARKLGEFLDGKTEILADLTQLVSQLFTCQSCSRSDTGRISIIIAL